MKFKRLIGVAASIVVAASVSGVASAGEMVAYKITNGEIKESLTGKPGNPVQGRNVAIHRKKGNCLSCHKLPIPHQPFHGEVGPSLMEVGANMTEGELRLRVVDPKHINADTIMPSFYKSEGLNRVRKKFKGKTILSPEEVEDVVAYLKTLK